MPQLPVVLTPMEAHAVLAQLEGAKWLMASLLYGSGLRLMECLRLRVKDVDFGYKQILVRDGKGAKDRVTMLPAVVVDPLKAHLANVMNKGGRGVRSPLDARALDSQDRAEPPLARYGATT